MFDPLLLLSTVLMQVGARYIDIELTPLQIKILKDKHFQYIILFTMLYLSLNSVLKASIIVAIIYVFISILFNENSKFNILSNEFLFNEGLIDKINEKKKAYYKIINDL